MDDSLFYNPQALMSHNRILNFVVGARGYGKTFAFKKHCVKRFIEHGEQFIYIRRHKTTDFKKIKTFFLDLVEYFPAHKLEVKGREFFIDGKIAGYGIPLSSWQSEKSTAYPKVCTVLFDEFLIEKSLIRYLPNEVENLLSMLDTIIRNRDNVRCYCLSNATTIVNPYFLYFHLAPDVNRRFHKTENTMIEICQSKEFTDERKKTKFGKLIAGTGYAEMSLENVFTQDNDTFIAGKPKQARFMFTVVHAGKMLGVWFDEEMNEYYVSAKHNPNARLKVTVERESFSNDVEYVSSHKDSYAFSLLSRAFKSGALNFENLEIRKYMYQVFNKLKIF